MASDQIAVKDNVILSRSLGNEIVNGWLVVLKVGRVLIVIVGHLYNVLNKFTAFEVHREVKRGDFRVGSHFRRYRGVKEVGQELE